MRISQNRKRPFNNKKIYGFEILHSYRYINVNMTTLKFYLWSSFQFENCGMYSTTYEREEVKILKEDCEEGRVTTVMNQLPIKM